jgi:hypothetical protein
MHWYPLKRFLKNLAVHFLTKNRYIYCHYKLLFESVLKHGGVADENNNYTDTTGFSYGLWSDFPRVGPNEPVVK